MNQTLIIKGKTSSLNSYINAERSNRFMAAKIKKEETLRVAWECRAQRLKQMGKIDKATFRYYHADNRTDLDNAEFYQKYIWDGLVEAMVLPDDNNHYQPKERSHIHYEDKKNPRIEIEFEYEE